MILSHAYAQAAPESPISSSAHTVSQVIEAASSPKGVGSDANSSDPAPRRFASLSTSR